MYRHVEDDERHRIKFRVYRCSHCGALAVSADGTPPPAKCGKCHC